jgi:hypothetical protein
MPTSKWNNIISYTDWGKLYEVSIDTHGFVKERQNLDSFVYTPKKPILQEAQLSCALRNNEDTM